MTDNVVNLLKVLPQKPSEPSDEEIQGLPLDRRQAIAQEEIRETLMLYFSGEGLAVSLGCLEEVKLDLYQNCL